MKLRRSRRSQRWALGIVALSLGWAGYNVHKIYEGVRDYPETPLDSGVGQGDAEPAGVEFEIPRGSSLDGTLARLVEAGLLAEADTRPFKLYVLHKGAASKISAGLHTLRLDMSPRELLEELMRRPKAETVRVTIPEGKHSLQIVEILAEAGLSTVEELRAAIRDPELIRSLDLEGVPSLEGFLFPDTYQFRQRAQPKEILGKMVRRHKEVYDRLRARYRVDARRLEQEQSWGALEIVTLASIVEKETSVVHERPLIAGVFLNRLRFESFTPKLLQTDPTIIYGCTVPQPRSKACQSFEGRIRRVHLTDKDNVYNTYTHEGLPPGPISNPGAAALEAVFQPTKSRFLYFVARSDKSHHFSGKVQHHERAVDVYIRGKDLPLLNESP